MDWQTLNLITDLLADESKHFGLAAVTGLLVFSATWIICSVLLRTAGSISRRGVSGRAARGIRTLCLLLGLSAALLSHAWLDRYSIWYTTPLYPPLEIIQR